MKICTSITGWGNKTIRDLIQFATFSTHMFVTFYAIFAKTRLDSLNDCIQWYRPGNEDKTRCQDRRQILCTLYPCNICNKSL